MVTEKTGLKNYVARLERAGSEYSEWTEKLRKSVDALAEFFNKTFDVPGGTIVQLPQSFTFQSWPDGGYQLLGYMGNPDNLVMQIFLSKMVKQRESLLRFAGTIAGGWLNEVTEHMEKQTAKFQLATESIDQFTTK